jgi:D-alanyl-D-alanine carboxypeptidase
MKRTALLSLLTVVAVAGAAPPATASQSRHPVQRGIDSLVTTDGFPGALAAVTDGRGRSRDYTSGTGDLRTGRKVPVNGRVRLASNTKMFTATVVLQLVASGDVELDAPVETYLPGLVRGKGGDGRVITVRQLLQHTSGLPDYDHALVTDYFAVQHTYFEPRQLLDAALAQPAHFDPGGGWVYSNTNYVLAGLLVQKVTGRPVGEEITTRIIRRLGLRDTYWPAQGEQEIDGRHPRGYWPDENGDPVDVTTQDPSLGWAAGQLVGTPRDLNTFMTALLGGELLPPAVLAEMKTTVAAPDHDFSGTARYGLGIATFELSCGGVAWHHGGDAPGHVSRHGSTEDGRAATVVVTANPTTRERAEHVEDAVDAALCG